MLTGALQTLSESIISNRDEWFDWFQIERETVAPLLHPSRLVRFTLPDGSTSVGLRLDASEISHVKKQAGRKLLRRQLELSGLALIVNAMNSGTWNASSDSESGSGSDTESDSDSDSDSDSGDSDNDTDSDSSGS